MMGDWLSLSPYIGANRGGLGGISTPNQLKLAPSNNVCVYLSKTSYKKILKWENT